MPIGIVTLAVVAAIKSGKRPGLTPDRKRIFVTYLNECRDADALSAMADTMEKEGCKAEALTLRKIAARCSLSKEEKDQRRRIFRQAMALTDPDVVEEFGRAYEEEFCLRAARALYERARGLRSAPVPTADDTYITEAEAPEPAKVRVEDQKPAKEVDKTEEDTTPQAEPVKMSAKVISPQRATG